MSRHNEDGQAREMRPVRYFSEEFKRRKVREIEENRSTVSEISRQYGVNRSAVYKWVYKYSHYMKKGVRQVVEAKSDTLKIRQLKERIEELERLVGQKQLHIDYLEKTIEIGSAELGVDLKKKWPSKS
jgi:transposase